MTEFVRRGSIVRSIWGDGDMILLIFAGGAAEFALNRAVDWLIFTGKLPNDPIGRLFATAAYAQLIVFDEEITEIYTLDKIRAIHSAVERRRGESIPDWAHRDVLYMLIDYSEKAHALLHRPLTPEEQHELYDVFHRVGKGLGIPDLPASYSRWRVDRERHLHADLTRSPGTQALLEQYRNHLGTWRFRLLLRIQGLLAPARIRDQLQLRSSAWLRPMARLYPLLARIGLRPAIQWLLMPAEHLAAVRALDQSTPRVRPPATHSSLASTT